MVNEAQGLWDPFLYKAEVETVHGRRLVGSFYLKIWVQ